MARVLVTGCAGFIGSHAAEYFLNAGEEVVGIDNLSRRGGEANLRILLGKKGFEFYQEDIREFEKIASIFKSRGPFDLILHEAGQVAVTTSVIEPREDFEINALGTFNLLEATRQHSPRGFFEFSSTNKVYGKMDDVRVEEKQSRYEYADASFGIGEDYPLDFYSPYGCSKGCADQYVRDYSRIYGLKTVVLRQSCIYGTRQFGIEDQGWVAWFTIASLLEKPITIYGDGKQIRDILWVDELIDAYVGLYHHAEKVQGEVFNIGGGPENTLSLLELVEILKNEGAMVGSPAYSAWRPGDQRVYVSSAKKIHDAVGWKPVIRPETGVRKLVEWAKRNRGLLKSVLE